MQTKANWALLARYLSGECEEAETKQIETWIDSDPVNRGLIENMKKVWAHKEPQTRQSDVQALWHEVARKAGIEINRELNKQTQRSSEPKRWQRTDHKFRIWHVAAILIAGAAFLYYFSLQSGQDLLTIHVEPGKRKNLTLSDGTRVALDAGTSLSYPSEFESGIREVKLTGEGYFEVALDAEKPFIIRTGHAEIRVLGTSFNVRAWPEDQKTIVTVAGGSVLLRQGSGIDNEGVVISKGQQSVLAAGASPTDPAEVDLEQELGWMKNRMHFENATLGEILRQLERWYNIRIELQDEAASSQRLTLHIDRQSLRVVLNLIAKLTGLQYKQVDNVIQFQP